MTDLEEIKRYIQNHPEEVGAILDRERSSIFNAPEVKILLSHLYEFWKERPNKALSFIFYFNESLITELDFNNISINLPSIITEKLKTHRIIEVNNDFSVMDASERIIDHDFIIKLSNSKNIVFYCGGEGIDVVVRGRIFPRINIFYDETDRLKYSKKFHISELKECLKEYERFINDPGINAAFFANKALIIRIQPKDTPLNTLMNKPENTLRNNLLVFLNRNTQHTFSKENELNNKRELDLYTEVEGKKYLIEVKWLGQSINDAGTGFTKNVTDYAAREGVMQTLEYIQHLIENMRYNVHCGYLCVFDARELKNPVDYNDYTFVPDDLQPYFRKHFIKLDEVELNRNS